jgi:SpoVK/Ycf46/Vps4 family AAA+-type ATPase
MGLEKIEALKEALALTPDNTRLRLILADALHEEGGTVEVCEQYLLLLDKGELPLDSLVTAAGRLADGGRIEEARRCLDTARNSGVVEGIHEARCKIDRILADKGVLRLVRVNEASAATRPERSEDTVLFDDVGGLQEVKKIIHRMIILPYLRPDVYRKYGKSVGGGIIMFGPPGCGKTLLARATAGECGLPFYTVRIQEILDPYFGVSESNLHEAFQTARENAPCVLFMDEVDAIAYARSKHRGDAGRSLVDQLLQEMDSTGSENRDILIMGATNSPWDIDNALLRPGRFDRHIFVPPPDREARMHILRILTAPVPTVPSLNLEKLAGATPLFSGADLRALIDRAIDQVIETALETGDEPPLDMTHMETVLPLMRPSTVEWLSQAKSYVEFANQGDRYKDVETFLKSPEVKGWKKFK